MTTNHTHSELKYYGIYIIKNIITNDIYIGSTIQSFSARKATHISSYKKYKLDGARAIHPILYRAYEKYNENNFEFIILKSFKNKKDSETTKKIIAYLEERCINQLNPKYNVCLKPTLSGCPNLGRKLSEEWKSNIGEKSKLYRHTGDNLDKMIKQNKKGSSIYRITDLQDNIFEGSLIECCNHFNTNNNNRVLDFYNKKVKNSIYFKKIEKLKSQSKKLILYVENEEIQFQSYGKCDKYLQMWRGYTSTQIVNNKKTILNFKYLLINEDIV